MSAGYGYYRIEILKKDVTSDEAKAKECFDFCCKKYGWFGDRFVLDGSVIRWNEDKWADGIEIDPGSEMPADLKWIESMCKSKKLLPETVIAEVIHDYSESDYESNSYELHTYCDGKERKELMRHIAYNSYVNGQIILNNTNKYDALDIDTHRKYRAAFHNKTTDEVLYSGFVEIVPEPDSGYNNIAKACANDRSVYKLTMYPKSSFLHSADGSYLRPGTDDITGTVYFDEGFDIFANCIDTRDNPSEWEFLGIKSEQKSYIDEIKGKLKG